MNAPLAYPLQTEDLLHGAELFEEYGLAVAAAQLPAAMEWRDKIGWPRVASRMGLGGGCARIRPLPGGRYVPAPDGTLAALVLPVVEGPSPGRPEDLFDLVAYVPSTGAMFTRNGLAEVLGEWTLFGATDDTEPLFVFADPIAWARAADWDSQGGHGIVIVDWVRAHLTLGPLVLTSSFICSDVDLARRVRNVLAKAHRKPSILVMEGV